MAKELPYFRFTVQDWQNGKISIESFELQGLFISVCGYYWINDCDLTLAMLKKKFSNATFLLDELVQLDIIKHESRHDKVEIEFLNEQYDLLSEKRKARQLAGSKGGNAKAMLQQNPSYKDKDKDNNKYKDKDKINIPFEDFWNLYDRKVGKDKSEKAWLKLTNEEREKIMHYIPKYKIQQPDPKFRKHPQTFFNNKSWEDEILGETGTQKKFVMLYPQAGSTPTEFFLSDSELTAKTASGFWRTKEQVYGA